MLRYCYSIVECPEDRIPLSNDIVGVYLASEQHQRVIQVGNWVLETFGTANIPAHHYWTTLLYLAVSMGAELGMYEARESLKKFIEIKFSETNELSDMLRLLASAIAPERFANVIHPASALKDALNIGINHFPTSVFTAFAFDHQHFQPLQYPSQARSIYEAVAPKSALLARCLMKLGSSYERQEQWEKMEETYLQALSIWEVANPNSINAVKVLNILSQYFFLNDRRDEAEQAYLKAQSIFSGINPKSQDACECYYNLGELYEAKKQADRAIEYFEKAASFFNEINCQEFVLKAQQKLTHFRC